MGEEEEDPFVEMDPEESESEDPEHEKVDEEVYESKVLIATLKAGKEIPPPKDRKQVNKVMEKGSLY